MKKLAWMLIFCFSFAFAQEEVTEGSTGAAAAGGQSLFREAAVLFTAGRYQDTIEELTSVESRTSDRESLGIVSYWIGLCANRLQNFSLAIQSFDKALGHSYNPRDLNYEYGQALFAAEKLQEARIQFRESLRKKFKRAVSLYYIGYISRELGDRKKAVTFFKAIEKLPPSETSEVLQASEVQIGDIYLEQVEKSRDAFKSVETYVIPQYRRAIAINENSKLAPEIQNKIVNLQRKYDLIMFNLRNGRPVQNPPYFARISLEHGVDSNVTFAPTETTIRESRKSSAFSRVDLMGRYTFYQDNWMSISPELRLNSTYYHNRVPEIYRNDNYYIAPALRTAFEHTLWNRPASVLVDYDFSQSQRDVNAKKRLEFSSRSHAVMLGERFNLFSVGESTLRLRYRLFDSYTDSANSKTMSVIYEQIFAGKSNTFLLYSSYDRTRVDNEIFDTDSMTLRGDFIFARDSVLGTTPSIGLMLTSTDPVNNRSERGRELLVNPNARISKSLTKHWRGNLKYDYQNNDSKSEEGFAYRKSVYSVEIEYLF